MSRRQERARASGGLLQRILGALGSGGREDASGLVAELAEHQAELETQNEELRHLQHELSESRDRYFDLYELAPVSYLTLDERGTILESNLGLAGLLCRPRPSYLGRPFAAYLTPASADIFHLQLRRVFSERRRIDFELALVRADGSERLVRFDGIGTGVAQQCRSVLTDLHELKQAESQILLLNTELAGSVGKLTDKNRELGAQSAQRLALSATLERSEGELRRLSRQVISSQEDERRRLARELHDETGQALGAIVAELRALEDQSGDEPMRQAIHRVRERASQALRDVRHISHALHPSILASCGLGTVLSRFVADQQRLHGLEVDTELGGVGEGERLPPALELALFRVVQEAFTNIVKHAAASRVTVMVVKLGHQLRLIVEDDGRGFDSEASGGQPTDGLGILGMRERIGLLGGELLVESQPGKGTTVAVTVPVEP